MRKILFAGAIALALTPLAVANWASATAPQGQGGSGTTNCTDNLTGSADGVVNWSPTRLWPPNHKPVTISVSYNSSNGDGDTTGITLTSVEVVGDTVGAGKPNNVDSTYDASTETSGTDDGSHPAHMGTLKVLSERSGHDIGGRTYVITVKCTEGGGANLTDDMDDTAVFCVSVPHDQHHPIVQDGLGCTGTVTYP